MLYWGIFTLGFYLGIIFNLALWSRKDEEEDNQKPLKTPDLYSAPQNVNFTN